MMLRTLMHALLLVAGGQPLARDDSQVFQAFRRALERAADLARGQGVAAG